MIPLPNKPKIISSGRNKAIFEIEPLYSTYGVTIGNTLRRILLSSLGGAAITQVKIKGASHEFTTLPGLLEDVIIVLVNLRKLRFKIFSDEPQVINLSAKGEREVKGKDFKPNPQVELVNPEEHIATLTAKKAELEIEAKIEKGIGYRQAEEVERKKEEIGVIYLDAIFNPVKKVSYHIENVIVGRRTDFEKLSLEIETDGRISPEEAFYKANKILVNHFSLGLAPLAEEKKSKGEEKEKKAKSVVPGKKKEKSVPKTRESKGGLEIPKLKVEDLKLSQRTKNALLKNGLKTIGGILRKPKKDLLGLEGMGDKTIKEIEKILKKYGLGLK